MPIGREDANKLMIETHAQEEQDHHALRGN